MTRIYPAPDDEQLQPFWDSTAWADPRRRSSTEGSLILEAMRYEPPPRRLPGPKRAAARRAAAVARIARRKAKRRSRS